MASTPHIKTVGVQLTTIDNPYEKMFWETIEKTARQLGINLIFFPGKEIHSPIKYDYQYNTIYSFISNNCLDGLIISAGSVTTRLTGIDSCTSLIAPNSMPVISLGLICEGIPSITFDNRTGMKEALEHLVKVHKKNKIAFINGPDSNRDSVIRFNLYKEELAAHNIPYNEEYLIYGDFNEAITKNELLRVLYLHPDIDAVLAVNDDAALWALERLHEFEKNQLNSISVIGFDDIKGASLSIPPLTTVSQPFSEAARLSVKYMAKILAGESVPEETILPTHLVVRKSCGCESNAIPSKILPIEIENSNEPQPLSQTVIQELFNKLPAGSLSGRNLPESITKLVNYIDPELNRKTEIDKFLDRLKELLDKDSLEGINMSVWEIFIQILWRIRKQKESENGICEFCLDEDTLLKAEFLISESIQNQQAQIKLIENNRESNFHHFLQDLSSILYLEELIDLLKAELPPLGINSCFLCLFQNPIEHRAYNNYTLPDESLLLLAYNDTRDIVSGFSKTTFKTKEIVPDRIYYKGKRKSLILYPIFFRREQYGYILMEFTPDNGILYESLARQIGNTIKGSNLFSETQLSENRLLHTLRELDKSKKEIDTLTNRDQITGLFNRRGFLHFASQNIELAERLNKPGLLLIVEVEHLSQLEKEISCNEIDDIIQKIARMLISIFRSVDIIARLENDEFVILALSISLDHLAIIKTRIEKEFEKVTEGESGRRDLTLKFGFAQFGERNNHKTIEELLNQAASSSK
jgi:diguanylate cyclase (GGDEF)-like protein